MFHIHNAVNMSVYKKSIHGVTTRQLGLNWCIGKENTRREEGGGVG